MDTLGLLGRDALGRGAPRVAMAEEVRELTQQNNKLAIVSSLIDRAMHELDGVKADAAIRTSLEHAKGQADQLRASIERQASQASTPAAPSPDVRGDDSVTTRVMRQG